MRQPSTRAESIGKVVDCRIAEIRIALVAAAVLMKLSIKQISSILDSGLESVRPIRVVVIGRMKKVVPGCAGGLSLHGTKS